MSTGLHLARQKNPSNASLSPQSLHMYVVAYREYEFPRPTLPVKYAFTEKQAGQVGCERYPS